MVELTLVNLNKKKSHRTSKKLKLKSKSHRLDDEPHPSRRSIAMHPSILNITDDEVEQGALKKLEKNDYIVKRKCTDILFFILIIIAWIVLTSLGIDSIERGNPEYLLNGVDYTGELCGTGTQKENTKLYFVNIYSQGVCVSECPSENDFNLMYCASNVTNPIAYDSGDMSDAPIGDCMYELATIDILNYCVLDVTTITDVDDDTVLSVYDQMFLGVGTGTSYVVELGADLYRARWIIFIFGALVSMSIAFLYAFILRIPFLLFVCIWGAIIGVFAIFLILGAMMRDTWIAWKDEEPPTHENYEIDGLYYLSLASYIFAGLWLCLFLYLRKRISLAIGVVRTASICILSLPSLVFLPIIEWFAWVLFLIPWVIYVINTASLGDVKTTGDTQLHTFEYDSETKKRAWYMLFMYFWTSEFMVAMGEITIALAISKWYFTRDKSSLKGWVVGKSLWTSIRYHMGTAAFGSLLIAILETIRAALAYIERKATDSGNRLAIFILRCLQCCIWCFEKCLKYLNTNAYIQTAIFSTNFCTSAKKAFFLLMRNILRCMTVEILSNIILILCKVFVAILTSFLCYYYLDRGSDWEDKLYSLVSPTLFVLILSWITATLFTNVFGMTITTVLMCYLADEEMYEPEERFAGEMFKGWI